MTPGELDDVFAALANPVRRSIVARLAHARVPLEPEIAAVFETAHATYT